MAGYVGEAEPSMTPMSKSWRLTSATVADLGAAGLSDDEAFLVAVKRMGDIDGLSREFAREHSDRLWKQFVSPAPAERGRPMGWSRLPSPLLPASPFRSPACFGFPDGSPRAFFVT